MHLNIEMTTVNASSIRDVIGALQNILAHSRVIIPDLETPYSLFPNIDHSAIGRGDKSISAIITERQQQLDAVVQEISGLESVMDRMRNLHQQLLKKKDEIIQSMNLHRGLLSALWRLPSEILSLIFVRCLPETEHLLPSPTLAPVLLTRICRRWRDVAIGMSSLWCGALIVDNSHKEWQRAAFCYNTWFERSRDLPLSLVLKCFKNYTTHLRSLLEPRMSKISSLHIIIFLNPFDADLLLNDLLVLQELTITTSDPLWCTPRFAQSISGLPSTLRRLRVAGPSAFDFDRITSCNPVWAHLTHVEIAICQPNLILQLLQLGPNLSSLEIGLGFYDEVPLTFEPFMHANLQFFRISNASPMRMGNLFPDLFNALTLPNLRILEARYIRPWPHEELKTFLARSSCPLESLIFGTGVTTTDEQRGEYIVLVPFLDVVVDHRRSGYFGYRRLR
ncbi:uncharacterized protein F5891DRAFT_998791 [Suillus fuscotomentosus]|uniref:F-box domain-containing protein n=1 Tax=Suillus fuscotomentosus TaxID=1912939 RepID=A0AAD4HVB2_9AGAM|nr:uncharacterized protein F5891DRAFT_998791 [Suillus fuscotomentosus]KAG1908099.1 hypothetical protein F5891DRAFT_998791 [Suillus fuscotomentosus]